MTTISMIMKMRLVLTVITLAVASGLAPSIAARADVAEYVVIEEEAVSVGQLVSLIDGKYQVTARADDEMIVGVIVDNPDVAINLVGHVNSYPIAAKGEVSVLVSAAEGNIEPGDYVTSSNIRGSAVKARRSGFMIGQAREGFDGAVDKETGLIQVKMLLRWIDASQFTSPSRSLTQRILDGVGYGSVTRPVGSLATLNFVRWLVVAAVTFFLFSIIGFYLASKVSKKREQVLRNDPLAIKTIEPKK